MILSLRAQRRRDVFVSRDEKAFISGRRRERLERMLATRICTPAEAVEILSRAAQKIRVDDPGTTTETGVTGDIRLTFHCT
jgi:hypothetical protein